MLINSFSHVCFIKLCFSATFQLIFWLQRLRETWCTDILKRTDSNQPDYAELMKAIAALEEVLTLVVNCCCVCCQIFLMV